MINEKSDIELLRQGSPQAFERLFHQHSAKLYNFMMKVSSGDTYMAEEIVQRTFVKIWDIHEQVNPNKSFISFLCTIAKNMLMNEYKHQTVEYVYQEYISNYFSGKNNVTPEKELDKKLLETYIDSLIDKLPPARRQIFILSRKEMLSNKEIAEKLNITESTIQTQLSKALSFMKTHLGRYFNEILFFVLFYNLVN